MDSAVAPESYASLARSFSKDGTASEAGLKFHVQHIKEWIWESASYQSVRSLTFACSKTFAGRLIDKLTSLSVGRHFDSIFEHLVRLGLRAGVIMPILKLKDADIYYEVPWQWTILFLSETACDGEVWKIYQVPEFSRDHSNHFRLSWNGIIRQAIYTYTMEMFADAAAILDHRSSTKRAVCGHSIGGRVAAGSCPEAYPSKVKKLILASSGAGYPDQGGIPLKLCMEMVQMGYEKPAREHTVAVGWTRTTSTTPPPPGKLLQHSVQTSPWYFLPHLPSRM